MRSPGKRTRSIPFSLESALATFLKYGEIPSSE
jgi:hypothetical protein